MRQQKIELLWDVEAAAKFFKGRRLSKKPILLNPHTTILDPKEFVESSLSLIRARNGNETYRPYWERLKKLKKILESNDRKKKKTAG